MSDRLSEGQRCIVSPVGVGKPWRGTVRTVKPKGYGVEPEDSPGEEVHVPEKKAKPESSAKKTAPLVPMEIGTAVWASDALGRTREETHQIMLGAQAMLMQEALELLPLELRVDVLARAMEIVDPAVLNKALR